MAVSSFNDIKEVTTRWTTYCQQIVLFQISFSLSFFLFFLKQTHKSSKNSYKMSGFPHPTQHHHLFWKTLKSGSSTVPSLLYGNRRNREAAIIPTPPWAVPLYMATIPISRYHPSSMECQLSCIIVFFAPGSFHSFSSPASSIAFWVCDFLMDRAIGWQLS